MLRFSPTVLTVSHMQCCVRLSFVSSVVYKKCIVAKRYNLEQKLVLAQQPIRIRQSYMRNRLVPK